MKCPECRESKYWELFPTNEDGILSAPCKACRNLAVLSGGGIEHVDNARKFWRNRWQEKHEDQN